MQGERRWYTVIAMQSDGDNALVHEGYWIEARSTEEAASRAAAQAGIYDVIAVYIGRLKDQTENLWCKEIKEERGG